MESLVRSDLAAGHTYYLGIILKCRKKIAKVERILENYAHLI